MLVLTDHQMQLLQTALASLPTEAQRAIFLRLIDQQLRIRSIDLESAVERAAAAVSTRA